MSFYTLSLIFSVHVDTYAFVILYSSSLVSYTYNVLPLCTLCESVAVFRTVCCRLGTALRDSIESVTDDANTCNFLAMLKLMSKRIWFSNNICVPLPHECHMHFATKPNDIIDVIC